MEFGMMLDVLDLPASLNRWDSSGPCEEGLLTFPSYDDFNNMKVKHSIFPLDNEDESSSGLSLGSSPSNASSTMNARLGLDFDFEIFDDASEHNTCGSMDTASASPSIISLPAAPLMSAPSISAPIVGLPIGRLNLNLNASAVASDWNSMYGNAPVFRMPRSQLIAVAVDIPSLEARTQSLSVEASEVLCISTSSTRRSSRSNSSIKLRTVNHVVPTKPQVPRPPRKTASSIQKRRTGGKSSDKRPRIKGRFVRKDELERFAAAAAAANNNKTEEDAMLVPEAAAAADSMIINNKNSHINVSPFATVETMGIEAQRAY